MPTKALIYGLGKWQKKSLNRGTWDRVAGCGDDGAEMVFVVVVKVLLVVKQCI